MASVKVGGRELEVRAETLGILRYELIPARKRLATAESDEAIVDAMVHLLLVYLGHNEGVSAEWILQHVPSDTAELIRECVVASGQKVASKGEAARP